MAFHSLAQRAALAGPWLLVPLLACGGDDGNDNLYGDGTGEGDGDGDGDGTGDGDGDGDGGPKLDLGDGGDVPAGDDDCDFVDILFVIDNSASMTTYQTGLTSAFPAFAQAMFESLPEGTDLHVGVTTSTFVAGGSHSESNCVAQESQAVIDEHFLRPQDGLTPGNGFQGRLVTAQGQSYFAGSVDDPANEAALTSWFTEAAAVGSSGGSFEFNAAAAAYTFHEANADANDGFIRDAGAVLVLFILSDEADQSLDVETLATLHDLVVAAKSDCGGDQCIVSGGLLSPWCTPDQNAGYTFLESFGEPPVWGDITGGNIINPDTSGYVEIVGDTLAAVVAQTCDEIPPVG